MLATKSRSKKIYISYNPEDKLSTQEVENISRLLTEEGHKVYIPKHKSLHEPEARKSENLLKRADKIVTVVSPDAMRSQHVWRDMALGRVLQKPVIPVLISQFSDHVPVKRYIDATESIEHGVVQLIEAIRRPQHFRHNLIADYGRQHPYKLLGGIAAVIVLSLIALVAMAVFA